MKTFEEIKSFIIDEATRKDACDSELSRVKNSKSVNDILQVIKDNLGWVSVNTLFEKEPIENFFSNEKLIEFSIANTGSNNTGFCNTGNRNTGDWNTGNRNTGLFNTITPNLLIFNQNSNWSIQDWYNSKAYSASLKFVLTKWISEEEMTTQEKIDNPKFHIQEGYLKNYSYKDACENWWSILSQQEKYSFKELPNFDEAIFFEITGCKL